MPKAILKRRLNFMNAISNKDRICDVPKGLVVHILKQDGKQVFILWKGFTKWVNEKFVKKI